jgi:Rrf2 family nitric oxide-sensitive transcriptional repressor
MRLTGYTDYTLRVLMFCAVRPEQPITIAEIAASHAVSKNHLMKIVNDLARQGILQTTRGRGGGLRLLKSAKDICIGDVVRHAETDFHMVECFNAEKNACVLIAHCQLKHVVGKATNAFLAELDKVTLADITQVPSGAEQVGNTTVSRIPVSEIKRADSEK